jgi:type II secretory pathway component PulM
MTENLAGRREYDHFSPDLCDEKHKGIDEWRSKMDERMDKLDDLLRNVAARPTNIMLAIVSALCTSVGMLVMWIITHGK